MTFEELERRLFAEGVSPHAFGLPSGPTKEEAYCIEKTDDGWAVFYREKGIHRDEKIFKTESEAADYFLDQVLKDPTTRIKRESDLTHG